jgi:hypothetical protein
MRGFYCIERIRTFKLVCIKNHKGTYEPAHKNVSMFGVLADYAFFADWVEEAIPQQRSSTSQVYTPSQRNGGLERPAGISEGWPL